MAPIVQLIQSVAPALSIYFLETKVFVFGVGTRKPFLFVLNATLLSETMKPNTDDCVIAANKTWTTMKSMRRVLDNRLANGLCN